MPGIGTSTKAVLGSTYRMRDWWSEYNGIFHSIWVNVLGTKVIDQLGGAPLTLSVQESESFISEGFLGSIIAPKVPSLIAADEDRIWFDNNGTPKRVTVEDLISEDHNRTMVMYRNTPPYDIAFIGVLAAGVTLTQEQKDSISTVFQLWAFYFGGWSDYGAIKDNRTFEDSVEKFIDYPGIGIIDYPGVRKISYPDN